MMGPLSPLPLLSWPCLYFHVTPAEILGLSSFKKAKDDSDELEQETGGLYVEKCKKRNYLTFESI